ncbi:OmpC Outer membrane protein (porin) [Candidatus Methylopumilus universalis]|uniref:porin n=1 Tax=Candidatus Methylopumilus universalis TaxID=2588536 RepID=UPI003BEF4859
MNKNIKLAVAGAVLALSASANAGIIIPAGEWTMDINGNVNAFANVTKGKGTNTTAAAVGGLAGAAQVHEDQAQGINTGLLPAWLGFTGTTRQNDLDVSFTISMQPNVSDNFSHGDAKTPLNRQAFLTFGDKSWGSVKLGKDIGIFASDAILNDMTLLGVGAGAATSGAATTLGGIGTGYIYAAWKGQVAYTTPNFNGFQATVGITNPNQGFGEIHGTDSTTSTAMTKTQLYQDRFGLEGKASYAFSGDVASGKVWVSGASYDVTYNAAGASYTATVADIGLNVNAGNLGLTGYWYTGEGVGTTVMGNLSADANGNKRDSDGGYIQATYVLPTKTKLGLAYGTSNLDRAITTDTAVINKNERITIGLYHPLTKHLNLVAEYNDIESRVHTGAKGESSTGSLGAILFF